VALFRDQVGIPPKLMARIVRFDRLVQRLRRGGPRVWADLALEFGYYDQAHRGPAAGHRPVRPARVGQYSSKKPGGPVARARYVAGSFFDTPPPPADVYLLKSVIHDWDDERSLRILARCREAMGPGTRLVLVEATAGGPAGDPLAGWFMAFSDLNMLVNTGGRERTEGEYVALLRAAGLEVTAVKQTGTFYHVFESVRA